MPEAIPEKYRDLFNKRAFASLATLMPDGRPQVTPVWVDLEGDYVVFNSAKGRQKDRNVRRDPRVALAIVVTALLFASPAMAQNVGARSTWPRPSSTPPIATS